MSVSEPDKQFLIDVYSAARNKYRPRLIKTLLIAEAPPNSLDRFFYFEDVKRQDSLFLEIMGVLYSQLKERYLKSGRQTLLKEELLQHFQSDGYWLMDVSEIPLGLSQDTLESCVPFLLNKLRLYINKSTMIILIKSSVFNLCYPVLYNHHYNVWKDKIPFPGSGQQKVFREKFRRAINN